MPQAQASFKGIVIGQEEEDRSSNCAFCHEAQSRADLAAMPLASWSQTASNGRLQDLSNNLIINHGVGIEVKKL
jgi:hypothetical protein